MSFRLVRLGRRGLGEEDARDFCARVGTELVHLLEERATLFAELHPLAAVYRNGDLRCQPFRGAPARPEAGRMPGNVYVT